MYFLIATIFTASSVPAMYLGLRVVRDYDLPFVLFSVPVLLVLGIACWAVSKLDDIA